MLDSNPKMQNWIDADSAKADNSQHKIGTEKEVLSEGESESDNEEVEQRAEGSNEDGEDIYIQEMVELKKEFSPPAFDKSKKRSPTVTIINVIRILEARESNQKSHLSRNLNLIKVQTDL